MSRREAESIASPGELVAYLAGCAAGLAALVAFGFVDAWLARFVADNDFSGIWAGARALAEGRDPYDPATWRATALALQGQEPQTRVYGYPGYVAVALLPLGVLPLPLAAALWAVAGMALAAVSLGAVLRAVAPGHAPLHAILGATLFLSQPAVVTFLDGQWGFVLVAALATSVVALLRGRATLAGATAVVLLAKPQLFLLALPALAVAALARGARGALVAFVVVAAALVVTSLALLPGWPAAYLAHVAPDRVGAADVTTLPVALAALVGPAGGPLALVLLALGVVAAIRIPPRSEAFLAAWLALSVVAAPYAWSYDLLILVVPLALVAGAPGGGLAVPIGAAALLVGALLLHGLTAEARTSESYVAFAGAAVAALVLIASRATALRPSRSASARGRRI